MGANEDLGLPIGKMKQVVVAFDIDGTLRNNQVEDVVVANEDIRTLVRILAKFKNIKIVVWSGSGELYAHQVANELHISHWVDQFATPIKKTAP
jgi:hydroxymethylpyrimidine pyrophosphatase-like HAD family hydrolase